VGSDRQLSHRRHRRLVKPRPHQKRCRSNVRLCQSKQHSTLLPKAAKMSKEFIVKFSPFDKAGCCFDTVAVLAIMPNEILSFRQSRPFDRVENKLNMFKLFLDSVERVERTKFRSTLLPKTATMSKQYSALSKESFDLYSTMLL